MTKAESRHGLVSALFVLYWPLHDALVGDGRGEFFFSFFLDKEY